MIHRIIIQLNKNQTLIHQIKLVIKDSKKMVMEKVAPKPGEPKIKNFQDKNHDWCKDHNL